MKRSSTLTAATVLLAGGTAFGQADDAHRRLYRKTADSVVAIRALAPLGERSGSGVILSKDGLVLTSYAACPDGARDVRVWVRGPRLYPAEIVATSKRDELTLLRIKPRGELKAAELGTSSGVRVGQAAYTIGNAANSIILDDQPSLNAGVVSALYRLSEARANSTYTGPVLETTAAVNVGMEGAPCLDASGRVIGIVTLNYSPHRFLGTAIPIDEIRPVIDRLREAKAAEAAVEAPASPGGLGAALDLRGGRVTVRSVDRGGAAEQAGLGEGDVILEIADAPVRAPKDVEDRLKGLEAGSILWIKAEIAGRVETVKVTLEARK